MCENGAEQQERNMKVTRSTQSSEAEVVAQTRLNNLNGPSFFIFSLALLLTAGASHVTQWQIH